jgi:predicted acetyltransferase
VSAGDVRLEPAARRDEGTLARLLELYMHDLSEVFPLEVGADGRFGYERLPSYWSEPALRFPFLIRRGPVLAGFALATRGSPASDDPSHLDVAEFFVLRRHRRAGVGREAAFRLFDRLPGHWVVRVSEGNRGGLAFWPDVVAAYSGGRFRTSRRPGAPHPWLVLELDSRPPRPGTVLSC